MLKIYYEVYHSENGPLLENFFCLNVPQYTFLRIRGWAKITDWFWLDQYFSFFMIRPIFFRPIFWDFQKWTNIAWTNILKCLKVDQYFWTNIYIGPNWLDQYFSKYWFKNWNIDQKNYLWGAPDASSVLSFLVFV